MTTLQRVNLVAGRGFEPLIRRGGLCAFSADVLEEVTTDTRLQPFLACQGFTPSGENLEEDDRPISATFRPKTQTTIVLLEPLRQVGRLANVSVALRGLNHINSEFSSSFQLHFQNL